MLLSQGKSRAGEGGCHLEWPTTAPCGCGPNDQLRLWELAQRARVPTVATNDVLFHEPGRRMLQDVVTAIRLGTTIDELGLRRERHADRHLKPPAEMHRLLARWPQALARTLEIADRCRHAVADQRECLLPGSVRRGELIGLVEIHVVDLATGQEGLGRQHLVAVGDGGGDFFGGQHDMVALGQRIALDLIVARDGLAGFGIGEFTAVAGGRWPVARLMV